MHTKRKPILILMAAVLISAVLVGASTPPLTQDSQKIQKTFSYSSEAFGNPLMGYAPSAWHDSVGDDVTLLYVDITWRELEPEEGVFNWEQIEEENQFDRWRLEGKHIVLRFLCDLPGDEKHKDIPDWLYKKTEGAGVSYHNSYGYGFCPDYSNPEFIAYHQKAVAALGERYGQDSFISYIELGSLGHWGEWHIDSSEGLPEMPKQEIRAEYIQHWVEAFPQTKILMRRPFAEAEQYGFGLYNDMTGNQESTAEWMDWIQNGGEYSQTGEEDALVPMPDAWKTAPIGGELTSSIPMQQLLSSNLSTTTALVRESHTTFLGPKISDAKYTEGYDAVLQNMGYRIWISNMELSPSPSGGIQVDLTWKNSGVAPLYADWPTYVQVVDKNGRILEWVAVDIALSELLPEETVQTTTTFHQAHGWDNLDQYTVQLVIVDPMTNTAAVRFANKEADPDNCSLILYKAS